MNMLDQIKERIADYTKLCGYQPTIEQSIHTDMSFNGLPSFVQLDTTLVTCKDCKYYNDGVVNGRHTREPYCEEVGELSFGTFYEVNEEDFCSRAERRSA